MAHPHLVRVLPARRLVVSGPAERALATAVASIVAEKFVQRSAPGAIPAIFEYGSVFQVLLDGVGGLGLLPGRIGKHAWMVVDSAGEGENTAITIAHVLGLGAASSVRLAVERARAAVETAGVLVSVSDPISSHDLPAESPGNPATFRSSGYLSAGYLSALGRWLTS